MSRPPRIWGPRPTLPRGPSPDLDEQADAIVATLREHGPLGARELRNAVGARYWGPGCFGDAVRQALAQGRVTRAGRRRYAAAERS